MLRLLRSLRLSVAVLAASPACGVTPDPAIADEFFERLDAPPTGFTAVPCPGREAKVESAWVVVHFAHDLRAQLRDFDTPLPPRLQERLLRTDLVDRADDVRCVMHDFGRLDPSTDPDAQDVIGYASNLYVLKAWTLFERGEDQAAWDHVHAALRLYGDPVGPGVAQHPTLQPVLEAMHGMLRDHPPSPATVDALVEAVDATLVPTPVRCAALRHELLAIAVSAVRVHFGRREMQAMARRYGLHFAMRAWRQHRAGQQGRPLWDAMRDAYDAQVPECTRRPFGVTIKAAATAQARLDLLHPPTGVLARVASDRLTRAGPLIDAHPDAVDAFYTAYQEAVDRVNATPRDELIETGLDVVLPLFFTGADPSLIGQDVLDALPIPTFEQPRDLPEDLFDTVLSWMEDHGYAFLLPTYEDVFRTCQLP